MNGQGAEMLRDLATELGTTAEMLWSVLVAQAPVAGWAVFLPRGVLTLCVVVAVFVWPVRMLREAECRDPGDEAALKALGVAVALLALLLGGLELVNNFYWFVTTLTNPEYWALDKILQTIGGSG